jgi:phosphoribosylformylglycinamidine (FGAM) synthase-like amidotransferase family enzyme
MDFVSKAKDWITDRTQERTSLDGVALIAVCGGFLMFDGLMSIVAWVGLGYGIYTLVKED